MTENKPIMIDGVDVSGCEFCLISLGIICKLKNGKTDKCNCSDSPNCYYKQRKRLEFKLKVTEADYEASEQECKSLRQQLNQLKEEKEELKVMFKDLSYENQKFDYKIEEQTKQLEPFKDEYFKGLETIVIAELAKKSIRLTTENRKLENALDEIEEYINTQLDELAVKKIKDIINGAKDIKVPHKAKE